MKQFGRLYATNFKGTVTPEFVGPFGLQAWLGQAKKRNLYYSF